MPVYLRARRVEIAKQLLSGTLVPIKEIAMQCGFCNKGHFARAFKSIVGTTPKRFRVAELTKVIAR